MIFKIPGDPVGKARPRMTKSGHTYTPDKTRRYEALVKASYQSQVGEPPIDKGVPITVEIIAAFKPPLSLSRKKRAMMIAGEQRPTKKPDADNIIKIICDALNGVAYFDDAQVVDVKCTKIYDEDPHVTVAITEIGDD